MKGADAGQAWDYSALAAHYDQRADYAPAPILQALDALGVERQSRVLDIGAGTGKLTRILSLAVDQPWACEPNDAMRRQALRKPDLEGVRWMAGSATALPLLTSSMDLVCFGSSFNVVPAADALAESARVLRPGGGWLAVWNHRDLEDPLQAEIERLIVRSVPDYRYGRRREDPTADVQKSMQFHQSEHLQQAFTVDYDTAAWLEAWRAHATLVRQAGARFESIMRALEGLLDGPSVQVPYVTRLWYARRR